MAAIVIDIYDLKDRAYRMLRDIEDGKYSQITSGVAIGALSCEKSAALDNFMKELLKGESK